MLSTNALSIYILQHKQNKMREQNIRSIQEAMRSDKPYISKLKRVRTDFSNLAIITKIDTPGEIQATYAPASVGNKPLGKTVTAFALDGPLKAPTVVMIDIERGFADDGKKIRLPTTEVLLHTAAGELAKLEKLRDWTARNAVLFPLLLTEIALTVGETTAEVLLKIFTERITNHEVENAAEASDVDEEIRSNEDNGKSKTRQTKYVMTRGATDRIAADCDNILTFPQAIALKASRVQAAPLSLREDKRAAG